MAPTFLLLFLFLRFSISEKAACFPDALLTILFIVHTPKFAPRRGRAVVEVFAGALGSNYSSKLGIVTYSDTNEISLEHVDGRGQAER